MAKFTWFDGNQGFYRFRWFDYHSVSKMDETKIKLEYDSSNGTYDPTRDAFKINMIIEDGVTETYEEGPNAGQTTLISGTITTIKYFDSNGDQILKISGLDLSAAAVWAWIVDGEAWRIDDYLLYGESHTFVGSDDATGPDQSWDGDDISTGYQDDVVKSKGGDDFVRDLGGSDVYKLGAGDFDTLTYAEWYWEPNGINQGVVVDLEAGTAIGPDGKEDELSGVENIRGTFLDDTIYGDSKDNEFMGYLGDDFIDGRGGFDWVDYRNEIQQGGLDGVNVNLNKGTARDAFRTTDTLINIEGAEGTDQRDFFTGDNNDNWFRGRAGSDRFIFRGDDFGFDSIDDFSRDESDQIRFGAATDMNDLTITYDAESGHAYVEFGSGTVEVQDWVLFNPGVELVESDFIFG